MNAFKLNLSQVRGRIEDAAREWGRDPRDITLVAVAKAQGIEMVAEAWQSGQTRFGENYLQEAILHMAAAPQAEWHFIGTLQSNKAREIATRFSWVHTVDRLKVAERLSAYRPEKSPPLSVCIQVNVDNEDSKSGCHPSEVLALASAINALPRLQLRGLMAVPHESSEFATQRLPFAALRTLMEQCNASGSSMDTLSMGMSSDLEAAVAEGATIVRIGSAIFGARS